MAKNKLKHFKDMKSMPHVFEPSTEMVRAGEFDLKGRWHEEFGNDHPIVLELGCGKGEYTVEMAKLFPDINFIGIDIKGARIWYGADTVRELEMKNVRFLRSKVDFLTELFDENEVSEIWLTFSDPQKEKPRKRLTSKMFMDRYQKVLKPGGIVHLKTDSDILYDFTMEEIEAHSYHCLQHTKHVYGEFIKNQPLDFQAVLNIKTNYEQIFSEKGFDIKYCQIQFPL